MDTATTVVGTPAKQLGVTIGSLVVEPSFLARVHEATWMTPDEEMRKIARRARGVHPQFHVQMRHGLELVFRGQGNLARLIIPA